MKIAVIAAMRKELDLLLTLIEDSHPVETEDLTFYEGRLNRHTVILAQCGIGKVNAALQTAKVLSLLSPDLVINSGVAGSIDASMPIGSILVADKVCYHDVWCGPGTLYGQADECPLYFEPYKAGIEVIGGFESRSDIHVNFGLLCSGDKFISSPEEVHEIKSHFPDALGCDMESAAIAQTCYKKNVPFMIVRVMSDMPGSGHNISEYQNFWNDAPKSSFEIVKNLILSL